MAIRTGYHLALFESSVVALDARKGKYLLYDGVVAAAFATFLAATKAGRPASPPIALVKDGVLSERHIDAAGIVRDYRTLRFQNFSSEVWSARRLSGRDTSGVNLHFLFHLEWNAVLLRMIGFRSLRKLERICPNGSNPTGEAEIRALRIPERFLQASLWSPLPITCLQMSFSIAEEFRRRGIDARLVIGVRPLPFVAHAWVEIDGIVHGDEANLPVLYGEIYRVPESRE